MSYDNVLAVIPCRRGSKRFPGKNTALFQGVPLVQNTIRIAKEVGIERIIVTTDDDDVMNIAHEEGAPMFGVDPPAPPGVDILSRDFILCTDDARMEDVVENAVHYAVSELKWDVDTICLLQVTSPLLYPDILQSALDIYFRSEAKSLVAINNLYEPVGAFYIVDSELFLSNGSFYQDEGRLYMVDADQCVDVDYPYQLHIANIIASEHQS